MHLVRKSYKQASKGQQVKDSKIDSLWLLFSSQLTVYHAHSHTYIVDVEEEGVVNVLRRLLVSDPVKLV